ncbi:MAG TPA: SagB family peptide dehydrogenase [Candidatus Limnocylindrales bacterium]|nr:SagB family peptide dehydrogenase [Candidatus Limnocylindrales bacterium]
MRRRRFLRLLAAAGGAPLLAGRGRAATGAPLATAVAIHRDTRNTLLGAVGAGLRRLRTPPPPFKSYPAGRVDLERPVAAQGLTLSQAVARRAREASIGAGEITAAELSRLLFFTNGDTGSADGDPLHLRAAPSAGALYAGELYVIAEHVAGLAPGVYYYDVARHGLLPVRSGSARAAALTGLAIGGAVAQAAALVIVTNVFERYEHRYANRGYRYALVDTGHIDENLRLAAASAGLACRTADRFHDDRFHELLEIDGREEAVCSVHALGRVGDAAAASETASLIEKQVADRGGVAQGLTAPRLYHEATKLVPAPAAVAMAGPPARPAAEIAGIALPQAAQADALVEDCIRRRRSPSAFEEADISLLQLATALRLALPQAIAQSSLGMELHVIAHRVQGLAPGLHRYDPFMHTLAATGRTGEDLSAALRAVCLGQAHAATAAAALVMVADVAGVAARAGERSYRDLLREAGAIGQRIYLAAEAQGLAARNLAAFTDDAFNELLGLEPARRAAVHLTMFGARAATT